LPEYLNLLEPASLVRRFLAHPPDGFEAFLSPEGAPAFATRFNLLTTAEDSVRRRVMALPLYRFWQSLLSPRTCFVGTTVSEYALLPPNLAADRLVSALKQRYAKQYPFLIVKDVPQASPLLDAASNRYAEEIEVACKAAGFVMVEGQALAYVPMDFASVEDYIAQLSSGRRKDIRRKLRARDELAIESVPLGSECFRNPALLDEYYALYLNVFRQSEVHFDLLSAAFFREVLQDGSSGGVSFEYRHRGELIGYNLCFIAGGLMVDKYVGFRYPEARELNLYFVSWFHNLGYALEQRLTHYVAGWTDPEIKAYLGASFTLTRHAVYIRNGLLRAMLRRVTSWFERDSNWNEARGANRQALGSRHEARGDGPKPLEPGASRPVLERSAR
jgi:Acetyltransferase (GNAT) domain